MKHNAWNSTEIEVQEKPKSQAEFQYSFDPPRSKDSPLSVFVSVVLTLVAASVIASEAAARCEVDVSDYVGWQIIYSGTVTGYINDRGQEEDSFEGCEYGRVLIVDYTKSVTCAEYSYSYSYMPDIVILANQYSTKACIDNEVYDVTR